MRGVVMAKMRFSGLVAAGVLAGWVMAGPAAADGLERFEKTIKPQIPSETLTYKSAKALGDGGFVLNDVVITPPPEADKKEKPDPISIKTIAVEDFDFDSIEKNAPPLYAKIRIEGVAAGANPGIDLKQMAGIDKLSADFQLDYKLDTDKETLTLTRLEMNLNGLGRLELSFIVDGVGEEAITKPDTAMNDATLRTGSLVYDDKSLLAKAVPIVAVMTGGDVKSATTLAVQTLDAMKEGQSEDSKKVIDALVAYVQDYEKPKGPLRVTVNPPDKASAASLQNAKSADEIVKALGLTVSYSGKRS